MRNNLKDLFGSEKPSVNEFIYKFNQLPSEKQVRVLKAVREAAFCDWNELPPYYRDFLLSLFSRYRTETLDSLHQDTILGEMTFQLKNPHLILRVIALLEGRKNGGSPCYLDVAFCFLLVFPFPCSVEYIGDCLRTKFVTVDDIDLLITVGDLQDGAGHIPFKSK